MTAITVEHVEEIIYEHFKAQGELTSKEVSQATEAAMQAIIKSGREEFYNEGHEDGSLDGYNDGRSDGYDDGYNDGRSDGYDEGYDDGSDAGQDSSYEAGYADAKEEFEEE